MRINSIVLVLATAVAPTLGFPEVFNHTDSSGTMFFAEVTDSRILLRERDPSPDNGKEGELNCPLARDVKATSQKNVSASGEAISVCVSFQNAECTLRRVDARGNDVRPIHGFSSFCINMANADQARRVLQLINAHGTGTANNAFSRSVGPTAPAGVGQLPSTTAVNTLAGAYPEVVASLNEKRASAREDGPNTFGKQPRSSNAQSGREGARQSPTLAGASSVQDPARSAAGLTSRRSNEVVTSDAGPPALFIHVRNAAQRVQAKRLVEPLARRGVLVTGIKLVGEGPSTTDLRYFYSEDAGKTAHLVRLLQQFGVSSIEVKHIRGFETVARPHQYELWLNARDPKPAR